MSKNGELKIMRYGRSIDAPINYRHRTGDSDGNGGNMLDLYAQAESAEEVYFGNADEYAREMFLKGFRAYMKKVFTVQEREFLKRLLSGKESAYKVGQALGVEHFAFLQGIQLKAYKNVKPLAKLARLTGWSGAISFTETIYKRLEQLNAGYALNEVIAENQRIVKMRERLKNKAQRYRTEHREKWLAYLSAYMRKWNASHPEKVRARNRAVWEKVKASPELYESEHKRFAEYRAENAERLREKNRVWYAENREEINERRRAHYAKNKERINAIRRTPERLERKREYNKAYRLAHLEEERERKRKSRARKREQLTGQSL